MHWITYAGVMVVGNISFMTGLISLRKIGLGSYYKCGSGTQGTKAMAVCNNCLSTYGIKNGTCFKYYVPPSQPVIPSSSAVNTTAFTTNGTNNTSTPNTTNTTNYQI